MLGVLGGMGPLATADFLAKLVRATPARRDQDHIPTLVCSAADIPDRASAILGRGPDPLPAMRAACSLDVLERDRRAGVLLAHRAAQEAVAVKHPDLGQVARVVADSDGLPDIRGQQRVNVAQPLEVDAVALHAARLGEHDQQQVEVLQALGAARQEAAAPPGIERRLAGLAVQPGVVGAGDEGAHGPVQLC